MERVIRVSGKCLTRFLLLGHFFKCGLELPTYFLSFSPKTISEFVQPYVGRTSSEANSDTPLIGRIVCHSNCGLPWDSKQSHFRLYQYCAWQSCGMDGGGNGSNLCDMPEAH